MSRSLRHWVISLFILLCLGIGLADAVDAGFYLTRNGQQAALFLLPHGVYLALLILLSRRYWPALILPPVLMLFWLRRAIVNGYILLAAPLISLIPAASASHTGTAFPLAGNA